MMDKIRYCKRGIWTSLLVALLRLLAVLVSAQPEGFLSIKCGGKANHTDKNNITWVPDADYIGVGETADIGNAAQQADGSPLDSLRFFPKPLKKSCYQLPVPPKVPYLLRLWFIIGNYIRFQNNLPSFAFSIETVDMLAMKNITFTDNTGFSEERILASSATVMCVCLIRTSDSDDPFISGIELRPLRDGMHAKPNPGTMLILNWRCDVGGNYSRLRYPEDNFDRIWKSDIRFNTNYINIFRIVRVLKPISTNNTKDLPPTAVMQTAWVANSSDTLSFAIKQDRGTRSLLMLYFAEIDTLNMSESRSFYVKINDVKRSETITLAPTYSALELSFLFNESHASDHSFEVVKAANSTHPPIINAFEHFLVADTQAATYSEDIDILDAIKRRFNIKDWISDPCYWIPWNGIGCHNSSSAIRISELDLSGRNLTGSVPKDIGQLTALVNVSLQNNHLMGTLPDFSNLTMVEGLYLQNNNMSGIVPEWLSELKSLKELNIANNNFNGVIPAKLLLNCSLKLNYSGNLELRMNKRKCTPHNSNTSNKLKVVLGLTISGIIILTLALIVAVVVYHNKFRRKEDGIATEASRVEKERKPFLYQDSRIKVPNPTTCRAFTLDEMTDATQNFSLEIGRGGFGSVFFGQLPEGTEVAVKVLSLLSHQGIDEFLNEVDLLSRINHKNLVSLLGYCNDTNEVMLIYEYMSRGSLRDHLYGPNAENSELNWITRLKIALDVAQGLEYLHMGCTPKIIHRDIKTTNILLDGNLNGKLADFGLSRIRIDGQATHVTTAVKGTFGYLDPEYYNTQMLTEKSDVYSFGVVLLEIICGRPPIDKNLDEDNVNIVRWATPYILKMDENAGIITEIMDRRLGGNYELKSISRVVKVAMRCVQAERSSRPAVSEVVAELKEAIKHAVLADNVDSSEEVREGMEWDDNSASNISKVGSDLTLLGYGLNMTVEQLESTVGTMA